MPLPDALFTGVQTDAGTDETLTTERTFVPFGPDGEPLGGVPPNMLDSDGALPAGILMTFFVAGTGGLSRYRSA